MTLSLETAFDLAIANRSAPDIDRLLLDMRANVLSRKKLSARSAVAEQFLRAGDVLTHYADQNAGYARTACDAYSTAYFHSQHADDDHAQAQRAGKGWAHAVAKMPADIRGVAIYDVYDGFNLPMQEALVSYLPRDLQPKESPVLAK